MILAHISKGLPKAPRRLPTVLIDEVSVSSAWDEELPKALRDIERPAWLVCPMASPHVDNIGDDILFVVLAIRSKHVFGMLGAIGKITEYSGDFFGRIGSPVPPGTLFVVDPMKMHWLSPPTGALSRFVALEWCVGRRRASCLARRIVSALGGKWAEDDEMGRYKTWRPR